MTRHKQKRPRTYARHRTAAAAITRRGYSKIDESDGVYFLKLVCVVLLATLWIKFGNPISIGSFPIYGLPVGMLAGMVIVHQFEKNPADRKIWYAILVIIGILTFFVPAGIVL